MPVRSTPPKSDGWWRDAVFYEVFVRSFHDSDGDGVGDLRGLRAKLDYIRELGANALWLMPIHPASSYHGYDVLDYQRVNPDYGKLEDFKALLDDAHARGIRVVIDLVLNHASKQHPWFLESSKSPSNPKRDYFLWSARPPEWKRPWDDAQGWRPLGDWHYYGVFDGGMPDWNLRHPEVRAHLLESMRFWLKLGVDGFRVDAARYLMEGKVDGEWIIADHPDTHSFVKRIRRELSDEFPDALFVAEAWGGMEDAATYHGEAGEEFQLAFNFHLAWAIKDALASGTPASLNESLRTMTELLGEARAFEAAFISNHDMKRSLQVPGFDLRAARGAIALLMALPGTPFLYYGEEIGMRGGEGHEDEKKRAPMRWTSKAPGYGFTASETTWTPVPDEAEGTDVATQHADEASLLNIYRALVKLRRAHVALRRGKTTQPALNGGGRGATCILRESPEERVLAVFNFHPDPAKSYEITVRGTPELLLQEGLKGTPRIENGVLKLEELAGRGFAFLELRDGGAR